MVLGARYLRSCAHNYADRLGLLHESIGEGKNRHVKLTLTASGASDPVNDLLSLDQPQKKPKPVDPAAANIKWDRALKGQLDLCAAAEAKGRLALEEVRLCCLSLYFSHSVYLTLIYKISHSVLHSTARFLAQLSCVIAVMCLCRCLSSGCGISRCAQLCLNVSVPQLRLKEEEVTMSSRRAAALGDGEMQEACKSDLKRVGEEQAAVSCAHR